MEQLGVSEEAERPRTWILTSVKEWCAGSARGRSCGAGLSSKREEWRRRVERQEEGPAVRRSGGAGLTGGKTLAATTEKGYRGKKSCGRRKEGVG